MMDWISVNDELPTEEGEYLITFTAKFGSTRTRPLIQICEWAEYKGEYYWSTDIFDYSDIEVLAWMPLPEPYKAGDADESNH